MKLVNLTPHSITIMDSEEKVVVEIPPSGKILRLEETVVEAGEIDGIPLVRKVYGVPELPPREPDTVYVVAPLLLQYVRRADFVAPDTGPQSVVRDAEGRIIGVKRFMTA